MSHERWLDIEEILPDYAQYATGDLKVWRDESHPGMVYYAWFVAHFNQAHARMHRLSDDDRLRWLLDFTRVTIEDLSHEAQIALAFDLHQFIYFKELTKPVPVYAGVPREPQLLDIQRQVTQGLHALMDPNHQKGWPLPTVGRRAKRVSALGNVETVFTVDYEPDDIVAVLVNAMADFVVLAGQHLRVCAHCRALFVANKRQAYCTPACSQAKRTQRKKDRMRPVPTDEKPWYTR